MYIATEVFKICLSIWKHTILQLCSKKLNNPEERLQINQLKVEVKTKAEKNSWQYISTALSESVYTAFNEQKLMPEMNPRALQESNLIKLATTLGGVLKPNTKLST